MKHIIRNILLILLSAVLLVSFAACGDKGEQNTGADGELLIETVKIIPAAYINEPYDLSEILILEQGVEYSATARYTEVTFIPETNEYSFVEIELEVKDLVFTPVSLKNTIVTLQAKRGDETATKVVSVSTTVRADPLDDLYKSTGTLGWAEAGISKNVCNDSRYVKGENSATSLHVKFDGVEPHEWGQNFLDLSSELAQRHFTDQLWNNAIVTFWVYNPMDQDIEFQLVINDHTHAVMTDWTGEEGNFRRQFAKAGEWTQIFFSLRRMGTTHKLINNQFNTETLFVKFRYNGFSLTENYTFDFYLDDLDIVPAETYPDIDTTYTFSNETLEQGWENMVQDTGWQGATTVYVYDDFIGEGSQCSLNATFNSDKGTANPFIVLNPAAMIGTQFMPSLPDMTGGTLTAYFKFENCTPEVNVDLIKESGDLWLFSNALPMQLTSVGNGWYQGTLNVNDFDFTTDRNDEIIRVRFTFSGINASSKVWMDTVKFEYEDAIKVKESIEKDWINLPQDSGMTTVHTVKFSTQYVKAPGSVRSVEIVSGGETGVITFAPEYSVIDGKLSSTPNMTKGTVHAYFYFGNQTPEAYMRLYNSSWKYCKDVKFIFDSLGGGWYYGSIPASLFQGYPDGNSSSIIRISILIPAGYTVYLDGLMHYPNEQYSTSLNPDDVFASGIFTTNGFTGNSGCEVVADVTNNSKDAIHMWAKSPIGWPDAGVRFSAPVDISEYTEMSIDVKAVDAHPWIGVKLYYQDQNGAEQSYIAGADFVADEWQTVRFKLSQFGDADLTKVTGFMICVNYDNAFKTGMNNQFWLDNLKLTVNEEDIGKRGQVFKGGEGLTISMKAADYESISFEYLLTSEGTMTLILRDPQWAKYFGDFTFDANGLVYDYQTGITTEKLEDGYIRVTMVMDELNRSGTMDNRDNAPETIGVFDIFSWTTADGYVDKIEGVVDDGEPSEPTEPEVTEPEEPTEPESMELSFTAGVGAYIEVEPKAYKAVRFDYKLAAEGNMTLILRDPSWAKYYGDFTFNTNGLVYDYQTGITTEKLEDGYIRVTMEMDELNRTNITDNRDNAPETIGVFDIFNWTNVDGHIRNIELLMEAPEEPTEPEVTEPEVTEPEATEPAGLELSFTAGNECYIEVTPGAYKAVRFDYKLAAEGVMCLILRDPNWGKYYGGFEFNTQGLVWSYQTGITTEKLDNGYIRVTMILDELNRTGMVDNRDNAPETIGVFDIFSWTTVDGHIDNIELLMDVPEAPEDPTEPEVTEPEVTEPAGLELNFTAGNESFIEVTPDDYDVVKFDYKLAAEGTMTLILRDPNWGKYYGDFTFDANGLVWSYQTGITTEKLDNGYIRVTMVLDELNRSGLVDNRDNAPDTIGVFDVFSWTTVDGHIQNIELLKNEVEAAETYELNFAAGAETFLEIEPKAYKAITFDYKLAAEGQMSLILRDSSWLKYYGDFTFNNEGLVWSYQTGITTEKLDNGYIRVTMVLAELNRTNITDNRDNAPETIAVFDVYSWTTVNGHIENLQFLMNVPQKGQAQRDMNVLHSLFWRKPRFWELGLLEQEMDEE